jgi:hypothetical protein
MNRFLGAACALFAILLLGACTSAPGSSPAGSVSPGGGTSNPIASGAVDTAQEELCDTSSPTGLQMLADDVEAVDDTTDVDALSDSLETALTNLGDVEGDAATEALATAAASAGQAFQQALSDPNTRAQTAATLAQALRDVEDALCG